MKIINPNIWRKFRLPLILTFVLSSLLIAGVSFAASNDHLKNAARGQCLQANTDTSIAARNCITNEPKQTWVYNSVNQLVNANGKCLTATARNVSVTLSACRINNARAWVYDSTQHFKNTNTGQCLTVNNGALNGVAKVSNCINTSASQQWQFTTIAPPAANWLQHDIKLNGIGVGVDSINKNLLYSLGDGFNTPTAYDAVFNFGLSGYTLEINGTSINSGSSYHFSSITYGSTIPIQRYLNGTLVDTYNLIFTNLPVIQLDADQIIDEPKLPGTIRVMSGKFNQDTGILNMGIELRGSFATQSLPKKAYSLKITTAPDLATGLDVKLLDLRNDNSWILDAVYRDQIFVRNIVCHDIFRALRPSAYVDQSGALKGQASIRGYQAEVIQNQNYQGIYVLEEKPDRKLYALQKITVPTDSTTSLPRWDLVDFNNPQNGSVLYKAGGGDTAFYDTTTNAISSNFSQEYPDPVNEIERYQPLVEFSNFVATSSDEDFIAGIGNRIDIDSVVDWWLLVDASASGDNMKKNFLIGKSGSGKFFMSTWDHDASFGMDWEGLYTQDAADESFLQWQYDENNLIRRLTELPATGFNAKLKARWSALQSTVLNRTNLDARFTGYLAEATKGKANARNKSRWPGTGYKGVNDTRLGTVSFIDSILVTRLPVLDQTLTDLLVQ